MHVGIRSTAEDVAVCCTSRHTLQVLGRHYTHAAMGEFLKVVGSLDIFGDVARLLQGLGLGMWHLFAMPAEAAMRGGPLSFVSGGYRP